jgi:glycosyltransferase involved in cell wall biosynthesis
MNTKQVGAIVRRVHRKPYKDPLNCLVFPAHEGFESCLAQMPGIQFLGIQTTGMKQWEPRYRSIPLNYKIVDFGGKLEGIPTAWEPELILSHNLYANGKICDDLSRYYNVPWVSIEHCARLCEGPSYQYYRDLSARAAKKVFISEWSRENWGFSPQEAEVVHHGIDTERYKPSEKPRQQVILSIGNLMRERGHLLGWDLLMEATKGLPLKIVGDNQGISKAASCEEELISIFQDSAIYFCPAQISPISHSLLEAMSVGCAVIAASTCAVPSLLTNGKDCLLGTDAGTLRAHLIRLLNNPSECKKFGDAARQTIKEKFNLEKFTSGYQRIFEEAIANYR